MLNITGGRDVIGLVPPGKYSDIDNLLSYGPRTVAYMRDEEREVQGLLNGTERRAVGKATSIKDRAGISLTGGVSVFMY